MNTITNIARKAINDYLEKFEIIEPDEEMIKRLSHVPSGVYITIFKPDGEIRTMGGSVYPLYDNIVSEIAHTAVKISMNSDTYEPLTKTEVKGLKITVDIIKELTNVTKNYLIDTRSEGIYVESLDKRTGIIVPNFYTDYSMSQLVNMACQQGKINSQLDHYKIFIFKTERFVE